MSNQPNGEPRNRRTISEELEVAGNQLVQRVEELVREGNVRRLIIRSQDDNTLFEMPLTIGAVAGGVLAITFPWLAMLGALGALVARVKIEIVREVVDTEIGDAKVKVDVRESSTDDSSES